jgi:hypothetical protein
MTRALATTAVLADDFGADPTVRLHAQKIEEAWAGAFAAYLSGAISLEAIFAIEGALGFPPRPPLLSEWSRRTGRTKH